MNSSDIIALRPRRRCVVIKALPKVTEYKGLVALPDRMTTPANNGIVMRIGSAVQSVTIGEWVLYNWRQATPVPGRDDLVICDERSLIAALAEPHEVDIHIGVYGWVFSLGDVQLQFMNAGISTTLIRWPDDTNFTAFEAVAIDDSGFSGGMIAGIAKANRIPIFDRTKARNSMFIEWHFIADLIPTLRKHLR